MIRSWFQLFLLLQQDEKLVELYYMDSFSKLVHQDNMNNVSGYLHKYVSRVILSHFGHEALKQKLMSEFEDAINHELLHEWTKQPEVDVKHQTANYTRITYIYILGYSHT